MIGWGHVAIYLFRADDLVTPSSTTDWTSIAAWAVVMVTAIFLAVQSYQSARAQRRHYQWERRQQALNYSVSRSAELRAARARLERVFPDLRKAGAAAPSWLEIEHRMATTSGASHADLVFLLANWENLGLAIDTGVVDEEVAYEMVRGTLLTHVRFFRSFIKFRQLTNPTAYCYLESLYERWDRVFKNVDDPSPPAQLSGSRDFKVIGRGAAWISDRLSDAFVPPHTRFSATAKGRMMRDARRARRYVLSRTPKATNEGLAVSHSESPSRQRLLVLVNHANFGEHDSIFAMLTSIRTRRPEIEIHVASIALANNGVVPDDPQNWSMKVHHVKDDVSFANATEVLTDRVETRKLTEYSGLWFRLDPDDVDWEFLTKMEATVAPKPVVNGVAGMRALGQKSYVVDAGRFSGGARTCTTMEDVENAVATLGEIVLKPNHGSGGKGLYRVSATSGYIGEEVATLDEVRSSIRSRISETSPYVAMTFSEGVLTEGDRRMLIAGGYLVGVLQRTPAEGKWLANLSQGGGSTDASLHADDVRILQDQLGPLQQSEIVLAGIDTIPSPDGGRWLSEMNVINVGGFKQLVEMDAESKAVDLASDAVISAIFSSTSDSDAPTER